MLVHQVEVMSLAEMREISEVNEDGYFVFENVDVPVKWLRKLLKLKVIIVTKRDSDGDFNVRGFESPFGRGTTFPKEIIK